jgi:uncharacterized protein (TIGR01777 family)
MKIIIGGGSGFIGRALVPVLLAAGHDITVIGRDKNKIQQLFPEKVKAVAWSDLSTLESSNFEAIINLAGANIAAKRWSNAVKAELLSSRLKATSALINWCKSSSGSNPHLYNASAIGYYGLQYEMPAYGLGDAEDNGHTTDNSFSRQLVQQWEAAANEALQINMPLTIMRFGVVLRRGEGMLKQLELPAKCGLSMVIGSGLQPLSWIDADDLVSVIVFLLAHPEMTGVVNVVAPQVVTQKEFTQVMAKVLRRPTFLTMPAWAVKIIFGQMGEELLLAGQMVSGQRLSKQNFNFKYSSLQDALEHEFALMK